MNSQHPITPPPELVEQWEAETACVAVKAARWGADQELEACCEALRVRGAASEMIKFLRTSRRPKPPSLKEQALTAMLHLQEAAETNMDTIEAVHTICRALEALPND